jgi:hypothetical protein
MPTNRIHRLGVSRLVATVGWALFIVLSAQAGVMAAATDGREITMGRFVVSCGFSHRNQDDAIVFPRQPGRSHDHTYFGNHSTNASSTPASLRADGRTSCRERGDRSAYWVPTLFVGGTAVEPLRLVAHYFRRTHEQVGPFPAGLKMIAGDASARSAQSRRVTSWSCGAPGGGRSLRFAERSSTIPTCSSARFPYLRLQVNFPGCWDGRRLDSPDHKRHMAYSSQGFCPRSHPVAVPALTLFVYYDVSSGAEELASGGEFSAHADFVNAWKPAKLALLVDRYLTFRPR